MGWRNERCLSRGMNRVYGLCLRPGSRADGRSVAEGMELIFERSMAMRVPSMVDWWDLAAMKSLETYKDVK